MSVIDENYKPSGLEIAIIGMSGRFPGADSVDELWEILINGQDVVSTFSDEELRSENLDPEVINDKNYIRRKGILKNLWRFDGDFFGYSKNEVEIMDPQMRILHEVVYEALEDAGYHTEKCDANIGMYSGGISNRYWEAIAAQYRSGFKEMFDAIHLMDKDFSSSRVSHKLDLRGPSVSVTTACTSSLTALHLACRGLLTGDCSMAVAGGYCVMLPEKAGYYFVENSLTSKDGFCRPFDENGTGTCAADGIGIVVLKLLEDAIRDKDQIYAVIKGSAINNDGSDKPIYTAPNMDGDVNAIKKALNFSNVLPETINFIEAHATGTQMGDFIEFEALKQAFGVEETGCCYICSHKPNIGYLGPASGITGLIKSALALKYKLLPPTINFEKPNKNIDFENSPFRVNVEAVDLSNNLYPLRASVNNIAVGGTNAHVILEEAPKRESQIVEKELYLLVLSAKTESALEALSERFCKFLENNENFGEDLFDIEYTLQNGRKDYNFRRAVMCKNKKDAVDSMLTLDANYVKTSRVDDSVRKVVFLFPDKGYQYPKLAFDLYKNYEQYKIIVDGCLGILETEFDCDLKESLFSENSNINSFDIGELIIFTIEYSIGKFLMEIGINPDAVSGFGVGEYVAACLSGVLSLKDAYQIIITRGKLLKDIQTGKRFKVSISEKELEKAFGGIYSLIMIEGKDRCIISMDDANLDEFKKRAKELRISVLEVTNGYAANSEINDQILEGFRSELEQIKFSPSQISIVSSITGKTLEKGEINANYWIEHLQRPVNLYEGVNTILETSNMVLLELGPGKAFSKLISQNKKETESHTVISMIRNSRDSVSDSQTLLMGIGRLWTMGASINWKILSNGREGYRISLPKYPFEGERYTIG
ncbi:MAG: Phthiocerol synthesis polyketide synthase type I PpsE [Firmicutes bacterium ADurb.Bin419]|nr:MAG: Phthiocerol synthesis polyketide synthase type I PpsE [Firmicutes bacterium ADurb.Bin419]